MYRKDGIFSLLGKINHRNFVYGMRLLKGENVHPGQMPLLVTLSNKDGLVQIELARKLGVKPSTLNVMVGRLEKNGMIIKKQDPDDQRKSRIFISEKGRSIVESIKERADNINTHVEDFLTEEEKKELRRLLTKLDDCLKQRIELEFGKEENNA